MHTLKVEIIKEVKITKHYEIPDNLLETVINLAYDSDKILQFAKDELGTPEVEQEDTGSINYDVDYWIHDENGEQIET